MSQNLTTRESFSRNCVAGQQISIILYHSDIPYGIINCETVTVATAIIKTNHLTLKIHSSLPVGYFWRESEKKEKIENTMRKAVQGKSIYELNSIMQ